MDNSETDDSIIAIDEGRQTTYILFTLFHRTYD